jgi:hypothetical protein
MSVALTIVVIEMHITKARSGAARGRSWILATEKTMPAVEQQEKIGLRHRLQPGKRCRDAGESAAGKMFDAEPHHPLRRVIGEQGTAFREICEGWRAVVETRYNIDRGRPQSCRISNVLFNHVKRFPAYCRVSEVETATCRQIAPDGRALDHDAGLGEGFEVRLRTVKQRDHVNVCKPKLRDLPNRVGEVQWQRRKTCGKRPDRWYHKSWG